MALQPPSEEDYATRDDLVVVMQAHAKAEAFAAIVTSKSGPQEKRGGNQPVYQCF
jgi:hypothetical protein